MEYLVVSFYLNDCAYIEIFNWKDMAINWLNWTLFKGHILKDVKHFVMSLQILCQMKVLWKMMKD